MSEEIESERRNRTWLRVGLLVLLVVIAYAVGVATGVTDDFTVKSVRDQMAQAGALGVAVFVAAFAVGNVLQVPGVLFMVAATLAYGPIGGWAVTMLGAMVALLVTFGFARGVGGQALTDVKRPFVRKILRKIDERPILAVVVLRTLFTTSPQLNYALALSSVRWRDYAVGTFVGLIIPLGVVSYLVEFVGVYLFV